MFTVRLFLLFVSVVSPVLACSSSVIAAANNADSPRFHSEVEFRISNGIEHQAISFMLTPVEGSPAIAQQMVAPEWIAKILHGLPNHPVRLEQSAQGFLYIEVCGNGSCYLYGLPRGGKGTRTFRVKVPEDYNLLWKDLKAESTLYLEQRVLATDGDPVVIEWGTVLLGADAKDRLHVLQFNYKGELLQATEIPGEVKTLPPIGLQIVNGVPYVVAGIMEGGVESVVIIQPLAGTIQRISPLEFGASIYPPALYDISSDARPHLRALTPLTRGSDPVLVAVDVKRHRMVLEFPWNSSAEFLQVRPSIGVVGVPDGTPIALGYFSDDRYRVFKLDGSLLWEGRPDAWTESGVANFGAVFDVK